jgi:glycosyltransferase involved in cell wall biosynthesis
MQISAIIPTYNYGKYVSRAIDSVLAQTRPVDELIVIDDGSTDGTRHILSSYGDRIRYVYQANRGLSGARNKGMELARHPWVAFLDSDDWWYPGKIARQVAVAESDPKINFIYTGICMFGPDGRGAERPADPPSTVWPRLRYLNMITPSTVMARRDLLLRAGGFDQTLKTCEDWEFWVRLGQEVRYGAVIEPMIGYQITPGSLSSKVELEIKTTEEIAEKTLLNGLRGLSREVWRRRITSAQLFRVSVTARPAGPSESRQYLYRSLLRWPSPLFMPVRWKSLALEGARALGIRRRPATTARQPASLSGQPNIAADLELARAGEVISEAAHRREESLFTTGLVQLDAKVQNAAEPPARVAVKDVPLGALDIDLKKVDRPPSE